MLISGIDMTDSESVKEVLYGCTAPPGDIVITVGGDVNYDTFEHFIRPVPGVLSDLEAVFIRLPDGHDFATKIEH